jgi:aminoglycoside phosphotransferase family enzyme
VHLRQSIVDDIPLGAKVKFLSRADVYADPTDTVVAHETHMSWVFLTRDRVYKLKKPVRLPYLDFSTLARREAACREELRLNRSLAPGIYLDVIPLTIAPEGLALGGEGPVADWLVMMRRLDESQTLERAILEKHVAYPQLRRLVDVLVRFYRRAARASVTPDAYLTDWRRSIHFNFRILTNPAFGLPFGALIRARSAQLRFLRCCAEGLRQRVRHRSIVDCHGDLRPEHIWLGNPVRIIDRLEFNPALRAIDPFDEMAFLSVECARLGAPRVGDHIIRRVGRRLREFPPEDVLAFYRCCRATLRARLAIAHLLESHPRTPEKWPRVARSYLRLALADAARLECRLRKRANPPATCPRAVDGLSPLEAARSAGRRVCRGPGWPRAGRAALSL